MSASFAARFDRILAWAAPCAALAAVAGLAWTPVAAVDYGWQLAAGRVIAHSGIPSTDVLSYTMAGAPWIEMRWLYCLALHFVEGFGGPGALVLLQGLAIVAAFGLAAATANRAGSRAFAPLVVIVAAVAASQRFQLRPELVSYLLLAVTVFLLHRVVPRRPRAVWFVPALQVLWTNTHTLFLLGPGIVGWWFVARRWSGAGSAGRDARVLALTAAACLAGPYGVEGVRFGLSLLTELSGTAAKQYVIELWGPFSVRAGYTAVAWYVALIALVAGLAAGAVVLRRGLDKFLAGLAVVFLVLSLMAIRNLALFALVAVPFALDTTARLVAWTEERRARRPRARGVAARAAGMIAVVLGAWLAWSALTGRFYVAQGDPRTGGTGLAQHRYAEDAARFLAARGIGDPVFATFEHASWLAWRGFRSYMDPRIEVFGPAHFERFMRAQADPDAWREVVRRTAPRAVVAGLEARTFHDVLARTGWRLAHFDAVAAVYLPPDSAHVDPAGALAASAADVRAVLPPPRPPSWFLAPVPNPAPYARVGGFLLAQGRPDLARTFLADAVSAWPRGTAARLNLAGALEALGNSEGARRQRAAAVGLDPASAEARAALALMDLEAGRIAEARASLEEAVRRHPDHALAWALLGESHGARSGFAEAVRCLERAVELAPGNAHYRRRLASLRASLAGAAGGGAGVGTGGGAGETTGAPPGQPVAPR